MIVQHQLAYFISVYYKRIVCCCTRILKENEGRRRRPQIWDWKANVNFPQILPYTQEIIGKIVASSPSRTPLGELTALPRPPSWWGGGSLPSPRTPPRGEPTQMVVTPVHSRVIPDAEKVKPTVISAR